MAPVPDYPLRQPGYLVAVGDAGPMRAAAERRHWCRARSPRPSPCYSVALAWTRGSARSRRLGAIIDAVRRVAADQ